MLKIGYMVESKFISVLGALEIVPSRVISPRYGEGSPGPILATGRNQGWGDRRRGPPDSGPSGTFSLRSADAQEGHGGLSTVSSRPPLPAMDFAGIGHTGTPPAQPQLESGVAARCEHPLDPHLH